MRKRAKNFITNNPLKTGVILAAFYKMADTYNDHRYKHEIENESIETAERRAEKMQHQERCHNLGEMILFIANGTSSRNDLRPDDFADMVDNTTARNENIKRHLSPYQRAYSRCRNRAFYDEEKARLAREQSIEPVQRLFRRKSIIKEAAQNGVGGLGKMAVNWFMRGM